MLRTFLRFDFISCGESDHHMRPFEKTHIFVYFIITEFASFVQFLLLTLFSCLLIVSLFDYLSFS
jgi:hypothetical protein